MGMFCRKSFSAGSIIFLSLALFGCGKGNGTNESSLFSSGSPAAPLAQNESVGFAKLRDEVLTPKGCIRCHGAMETEAGVLLDVVKGSPENSPIYLVVAKGSMPKNGTPLNEFQLSIVHNYIVGLVERTPGPVPFPSPSPSPSPGTVVVPTQPELRVTFERLKRDILKPKACLSCHENMEERDGLATYFVPNNPEISPLYLWVADGRMPRGRARIPLTPDEVLLVGRYILEQAPTPLPLPTPSPDPLPLPSPSPSPEPSPIPSPEPTPTPTPTPTQTPEPLPLPGPLVSFEMLRDQVLIPSCVTCHTKFTDPVRFARRYKPGKPEESEVYDWVKRRAMPPLPTDENPNPPPPMTDEQIELVRLFILQQVPAVTN